jgi:hypothetical protein
VSTRRSGALVAWANAWLAGAVASDEVLRAVTGTDAPHRVAGLGEELVPLSALLIEWRRSGGSLQVGLPVPGDVRGLPGPLGFRAHALEAGEAVFGPSVGAWPEVTDFAPSSASPSVVWQTEPVEESGTEYIDVADAQYELTTAVREAAIALTAADVAGSSDALAGLVRDARRDAERLNLPPGFPPRAVALVAQAQRLSALLELAAMDPVGGAVDRTGMAARDTALRPLATAVRRALVAGYNAGAR